MKNQNKITEGNAFALNIRQAVWRTLGGVIQPLLASELVDVHLYVGSGTSKSTATEYNVTADGDTISAVMPATLKRGVYRTWMTALYQGREVASACECAFEIVAFDEHGIYAPERIEGQPCVYLQGASMTDPEIEQYKARLLELQQQREQEVQALEEQKQKLSDAIASLESGFATDEQMQVAIAALKAILDSEAENAKKTDLDNLATQHDMQELSKKLDVSKISLSYDGLTSDYQFKNVFDVILNLNKITSVYDERAELNFAGVPTLSGISGDLIFPYATYAKRQITPVGQKFNRLMMPSLVTSNNSDYQLNDYAYKYGYFDNLVSCNELLAGNKSECIYLYIPKLKTITNDYRSFNASALIDIVTGYNWDSDVSFLRRWNPSSCYGDDLQVLLKNIREHIAVNIQDRSNEETKFTIVFNANLYAVMDEETKQAFTSKGWSLATY